MFPVAEPTATITAEKVAPVKTHATFTLPPCCSSCALKLCENCLTIDSSGTAQLPQALVCHQPEHGRSICLGCVVSNRAVQVSADRCLLARTPVVGTLGAPHRFIASIADANEDRTDPKRRRLLPGTLPGSSEPLPATPLAFAKFYVDIDQSAHCFDIFDAADLTLWAEPLEFSHIYVFVSAQHAQVAAARYPSMLFPITPVLLCSPSHASLIGVDASAVPMIESSTITFSVCSQCVAYQVRFPAYRVPAAKTQGSGAKLSHHPQHPNFYSTSLCRKANLSHLKKQRGGRMRAEQAEKGNQIAANAVANLMKTIAPQLSSLQQYGIQLPGMPGVGSMPNMNAVQNMNGMPNMMGNMPVPMSNINVMPNGGVYAPNAMSQAANHALSPRSALKRTASGDQAMLAQANAAPMNWADPARSFGPAMSSQLSPLAQLQMQIGQERHAVPPFPVQSHMTQMPVPIAYQKPQMMANTGMAHPASATTAPLVAGGAQSAGSKYPKFSGEEQRVGSAAHALELRRSAFQPMPLSSSLFASSIMRGHSVGGSALLGNRLHNPYGNVTARLPLPSNANAAPPLKPFMASLVPKSAESNHPMSVAVTSPFRPALLSAIPKSYFLRFRERNALSLFARHQFSAFRLYVQSVPIERQTRMESARLCFFKWMVLMSYLWEYVDLQLLLAPSEAPVDAKQFSLTETITKLHALHAKALELTRVCPVDHANLAGNNADASSSSSDAESPLTDLEVGFKSLMQEFGTIDSPMSLAYPSLYIQFRHSRLSMLLIHVNVAHQAGAPLDYVNFYPPTRDSPKQILDELFITLDEVDSLLRQSESDASFRSFLLHSKASLLSWMYILMSRTRIARKRMQVLRLLLMNDLVFGRSDPAYDPSRRIPHTLVCADNSADEDTALNEDVVFEASLRLVLFNAECNLDLALHESGRPVGVIGGFLAPKRSLLSMSIAPLLLAAFNLCEYGLTDEMEAHLVERLNSDDPVSGRCVAAHVACAFDATPAEVDQMLAFNVDFAHATELGFSVPLNYFLPVEIASFCEATRNDPTVMSQEQSGAPKTESKKTEAVTEKLRTQLLVASAARGSMTAPLQSDMIAMLLSSFSSIGSVSVPQTSVSHCCELHMINEYTPVATITRSTRPLHFAMTALSIAQQCEDPCSICACAITLAHLLIYWTPNYSLAMKILSKVVAICDELLLHIPPEAGPSFQRPFLLSCSQRARVTIHQFEQHVAACLLPTSPFFVGELVELQLTCGTAPAIFCALDIFSRPFYLCNHPQFGLVWAHLGTDLDRPSTWRAWAEDSLFDMSLGNSQFFLCLRALVHEMRCGRYSFAQFSSDVRVRSQMS